MASSNKVALFRQLLFVPWSEMSGVNVGTGGAGVGSGVPVGSEISTTALAGLQMEVKDEATHLMRIPTNWDRENPIRVRPIITTGSSTTGDDILFTFLYAAITPGTTALIKPATALDTVLVNANPLGTAFIPIRSTAGVMNAGALANAALYMSWMLSLTSSDVATTEDQWLLGVEFEFTPKTWRGHKVEGREWRPD